MDTHLPLIDFKYAIRNATNNYLMYANSTTDQTILLQWRYLMELVLNPSPSDSSLLPMTESNKVSFWKLLLAGSNMLHLLGSQWSKSWCHLRRQHSTMVSLILSGTSCPGFDSQCSWNFFQRNNIQCCRGSSTTTTNSFASSSNELDVGVTGFLLVSCHDLNLDFFLPETIFLLKTVFFFFLNNFLDLS